ncbi:MAG: DUF4270 family protein [Tunicatimonas sp.]
MVPFLLSCEDDNFLSLPADPSQQNLTVQQTRIAIPFTIVRQDSIDTSRPPINSADTDRKRLLAGRQTTELGIAEATTLLDFTVGPRAAVGDTAAYQSLELELLYERSYGATQDVPQTLEVRRLTQPFDDDQSKYYSSSTLAFAEPTLGTVTTSAKLAGGLDTLRFRLDDGLGQEIFDLAAANDSTVLDGVKFRAFLPGLAITSSASTGFVSSFDPVRLRLIMNFTNAQGEVREHTFTVRRYFSQVTGDYAGTALAGLTEGGSRVVPNDGNLYLQSGAGVAPQIKLDSLLAFVRRQEESDERRIRLNRVDLRVGLRNAQDTLNAPDALLIYDLVPDSLGFLQRIPVFDNRRLIGYQGVIGDQSATAQATAIPRNGTQYSLPISRYLSSVVDRGLLDQRLYLWSSNFDSSLSQLVTSGDSIYLDVNYTVLTLSDPD